MLSPGEVSILKNLEKEWARKTKPRFSGKMVMIGSSFTELKEDASLSGSVLSKYLKNLQEITFIERDFRSRKYKLTKEGLNRDTRIAKGFINPFFAGAFILGTLSLIFEISWRLQNV